jgi:hypothetical protein
MSGEAVGFLSIGLLMVVDIVLVAYFLGNMNQKVADNSRRIEVLESKPTVICAQHLNFDERLRNVEIKEGARVENGS